MKLSQIRAAVAACLCVLITACSIFHPVKQAAPPPPPAPPPAPAEPEPVATQRFEVAPDEDVVGVVQIVKTSKEDTLTDIARRFNVGYEEILRANPKVDPWLPGADRAVVVPTQFILPDAPRTGVVINIAAMRLFYYPPHKKGEPQVVITHPIGIGKMGWATPEGVTKIVRRQADPTWRVPASVIKEHREERGEELEKVIGPGPDNPLGKFAFYLQWPSYLIHGTNKPAGVGLRSSHGCIRLYPEDIAQLYDSVPIGTQVRVVNQPYVFGWHEGSLYMQPFDVLEDDARNWKKPRARLAKAINVSQQKQLKAHGEEVNWDLVQTLSKEPRGLAIPISATDASVDQVLAAATTVQNKVPDGSTWDGKSDLPMDEGTFRQMMSDVDPKTDAGAAPGATAPEPQQPPSSGGSPTAPASATGAAPSSGTPSSATPTRAIPAAKPRSAGPPVTSAAGSASKSTE
jgi:L,D-transpeptidase ErfK/SrfK